MYANKIVHFTLPCFIITYLIGFILCSPFGGGVINWADLHARRADDQARKWGGEYGRPYGRLTRIYIDLSKSVILKDRFYFWLN